MPLPLYADTVPPVMICGYVTTFTNTYPIAGGLLERVSPDAFRLGGKSVYLAFAHDPERRFAWSGDGTLKTWPDRTGLAFQAAVPSTWAGVWLARTIRSGEFRAASIGMVRQQVERVGNVEEVRRAELLEVSIAPAGANPAACVWLDDEDPAALPAYVAAARARWEAGRMAARLAAARPRAQAPAQVRAKGRPTVPASVVAALARFGPRGA